MASQYVLYLMDSGQTALVRAGSDLTPYVHLGIDKILTQGSFVEVLAYLSSLI